ncbi:MAG: ribonuclease Z [Candidatus Thermoplasmatota archaeon]
MTQLKIVFLGTGGSWPTTKRNVTSIAVKRGSEIILFDCGEGTQRQFQKSMLSYMQITSIFISHFHGDHFLGLPGLLQTMQLNDREKPIHIYGPAGIQKLTDQLLSLGYFKPAYSIISHEIKNHDTIHFDGYAIHALKVNHNIPAYAYCLEEDKRPGKFNKKKALSLGIPEGPLFNKLQKGMTITLSNGKKITPNMVLGPARKGRKIVYSGDTKPYDELIPFSKNADVLIHEATFDSKLANIADEYGHTTSVQAAKIAVQAQVEKLFLIHISPRYLDTNILKDEAKKIFQKTYIPNDLDALEIFLKK